MFDFGKIIQFMFFIIIILVMAKVFGFAENGLAVLAACVVGGVVFVLINVISYKISESKKTKSVGVVPQAPIKKNKKKNPNKKKSNTSR